jgi:5-methylcytosine-specific restriction endonuclease McrA
MQTKICTKCHIEKELTEFTLRSDTKKPKGTCKACVSMWNQKNWSNNAIELREKGRQYREANKEKLAEQKKQYINANQEIVKARKKRHYESRKEYYAELNKQRYLRNKDEHNKATSKYHEANKDKIAEQKKQYYQTPKGKAVEKAHKHNRRAQKINNGGRHTAQDILNLFTLQSGKCPYCSVELSSTKRNSFHVDHVIPISKGGSNGPENLQLLCPTCNLSKRAKLPEEFAAELGLLL